MDPSVAVLEFDSIARGIEAGDAMVKRAPLDVLRAGTVHPGRYLVLVGGATADVDEALAAGLAVVADAIVGVVHLPDIHPDVVAALGGARRTSREALGIIETTTVTAVIEAADAGVKGAAVDLRELRLADDLGGKGYVLFGGPVAEVEAAVEYGVARIEAAGTLVARVVIPQLHAEMDHNLVADPGFLARVTGSTKEAPGPVGAGGAG